MRINLNSKLLISIISVTSVIFIITFVYIGLKMKPIVELSVERMATEHAGKYANLVRSYLAEDMQIARTMADQFEVMKNLPQNEIMKQSIAVQEHIYLKHDNYRSVWMSWERKFIDSTWNKNHGRYRIGIQTTAGVDEVVIDTLDLNGDDLSGLYYKIKTQRKDVITNPYYDNYDGKNAMVASVCAPVMINGEFAGLSGIDIPLSRFEKIIDEADMLYTSTVFLVSNDGVFVGNQEKDLIGKPVDVVFNTGDYDIKKRILEGKPFSIDFINESWGDHYVAFYPFVITGTNTPWMVGVAIPHSVIIKESKNTFRTTMFVGALGFIVLSIVIVFVSKGITGPLASITNVLKLLSRGEINKAQQLKHNSKDEIGEIASSANALILGLKNTAYFAKEIGRGNLDAEFESVGDNDLIGNALKDMRSSLQKASSDEENRRQQEEQQNWATSGFAKFGDLLRNNTQDMEDFTYSVISNLIKYTNSNQGAIFLIDDFEENDKFIAMSSCYAYERKKFVDKRIEIGENLVGQCYLEAETIFMTDIPDNYINITSGLGDANPRSLILVPLIFNENVYGVLEMASFNVYKEFEISFIEKVAESIASSISTVKVNLRTVRLLEESKLKSEELAAQEEEMRQNMEELQTTQEESARREVEMNGILNALNSSYFVVELDLEANIISINQKALDLLGVSKDNIEGNNLRNILEAEEVDEFEDLWNNIIGGESASRLRIISRAIGRIKLYESYTPIYDDNDELIKILNIGVEVSD